MNGYPPKEFYYRARVLLLSGAVCLWGGAVDHGEWVFPFGVPVVSGFGSFFRYFMFAYRVEGLGSPFYYFLGVLVVPITERVVTRRVVRVHVRLAEDCGH